MTIIKDGTGTGRTLGVNTDNQGLVKAITESEFEFTSENKGLAFSWASQTFDPGQDDTMLLVKNTSTDKRLHIDAVWISIDTQSRIVVHLPTTNVTVAGTTITGVNLNTGSSNVAEAEAARNETGNSEGDVIWSGEVQATSEPYKVDFGGALILAKNKSIAVDFKTAATAGDVTIMGHYD